MAEIKIASAQDLLNLLKEHEERIEALEALIQEMSKKSKSFLDRLFEPEEDENG